MGTIEAVVVESRVERGRGLLNIGTRSRGARSGHDDSIMLERGQVLIHGLVAETATIGHGVSRHHGAVSRHATGVASRAKGNLALSIVGRSGLARGGHVATGVIGRHLGVDASSVWCVSNCREDGANGLDKTMFMMGGGILQGRLDDVVGIGVPNEPLNLLRSKHLADNHVLGRGLRAAKALLNDVGAELVAGELADAALEHSHNRLSEGRLIKINDVLDNIIAKGVLDKDAGLLRDALDEPELLVTRCMVNAALENAAAMTMGTHIDTVATDSIKDKLRVDRGEFVEALLDDVISVEVLNQFNHASAKSLGDEVDLLRSTDVLNHLLQGTGAVGVESNANHVLGRVLDENGPVVVIAKLQKLLAQIITKRVRHKLDDVLVRLEPYHMDLILVALLELLLEVAAAMLIFAKFVNLAAERFKRHILVARHCWGRNMLAT